MYVYTYVYFNFRKLKFSPVTESQTLNRVRDYSISDFTVIGHLKIVGGGSKSGILLLLSLTTTPTYIELPLSIIEEKRENVKTI